MVQQMLAQAQAQRQQQFQQQFPPVVGRAPPQQQLPTPTMGNHMMPPGLLGAYGQQAQGLAGGGAPPTQPGNPGWPFAMNSGPGSQQAVQLAGLLGGGAPGGGMQPPMMGLPYKPGMFMPGFRPGIDPPILGAGSSQGTPQRRIREY